MAERIAVRELREDVPDPLGERGFRKCEACESTIHNVPDRGQRSWSSGRIDPRMGLALFVLSLVTGLVGQIVARAAGLFVIFGRYGGSRQVDSVGRGAWERSAQCQPEDGPLKDGSHINGVPSAGCARSTAKPACSHRFPAADRSGFPLDTL